MTLKNLKLCYNIIMKKDIEIGDFYYTSGFTNIGQSPAYFLIHAKEVIVFKHKLESIKKTENGLDFYESKDSGTRSDLCYHSLEEIEQILHKKIQNLKNKLLNDNLNYSKQLKGLDISNNPQNDDDFKKIIEYKKIEYEIAKNNLILYKIEKYKINLKVVEDGTN